MDPRNEKVSSDFFNVPLCLAPDSVIFGICAIPSFIYVLPFPGIMVGRSHMLFHALTPDNLWAYPRCRAALVDDPVVSLISSLA